MVWVLGQALIECWVGDEVGMWVHVEEPIRRDYLVVECQGIPVYEALIMTDIRVGLRWDMLLCGGLL